MLSARRASQAHQDRAIAGALRPEKMTRAMFQGVLDRIAKLCPAHDLNRAFALRCSYRRPRPRQNTMVSTNRKLECRQNVGNFQKKRPLELPEGLFRA